MPERLALFDVDGTLCDTWGVDDECFRAAAAERLGIPFAATDWQGSPQVTDGGIMTWLWERHRGRLPEAAEAEAFAAAFAAGLAAALERAPGRFAAVAGAADLLARLPEAGWDVAIATGGWGRTARFKLGAAGLPAELLLASSDHAHDRDEIFATALARATAARGAPYARTVLVGDGVWDVRVAARQNWPFLGIGRGERADRLRAEGAASLIADFSAPEAVLRLLADCAVPRPPARAESLATPSLS